MRKILLVLMAAVLGMSGCAHKKYFLDFAYAPTASAEKMPDMYPLSITVEDNRPFVLSGELEPCFIGIQRRNPLLASGHVQIKGNAPLADEVKRALTADLLEVGVTVTEHGAERHLTVFIEDYNFDCYANCRVWHKLTVQVEDASGNLLRSNQINDEQVVSSTASFSNWKPSVRVIQKELPALYAKMIGNIVRNDPGTLEVLTRPAAPAGKGKQ